MVVSKKGKEEEASRRAGRREKDNAKRYRYPFWESSTKNMNACF